MDDRNVVAYGCRKTKKIVCGMEEENNVAYGRLPSSGRYITQIYIYIAPRKKFELR